MALSSMDAPLIASVLIGVSEVGLQSSIRPLGAALSEKNWLRRAGWFRSVCL